MKITDALLGEHAVLYRLLDYCADESAHWDEATVVAAGGALQAALKSHAHLEDTLLFEEMDPFFPPDAGPLAVMRAEHEEIEGSVERVLRGGEEGAALLVHIATLAREHFAKEEQILFPMAEQHLSRERLEEIGQRWSEERGVALAMVPV